jgi:hypothetical protein
MYDKLKYEGLDYGLAATPLEEYFRANPDRRPVFDGFNSGCRRGYVARWEIRDARLFLVGMDMACDTASTFSSVFPEARDGVFAGWVNGDFVCPYGKLVYYDHAGFERKQEHELVMSIENGVLKKVEKRDNAPHKPAGSD